MNVSSIFESTIAMSGSYTPGTAGPNKSGYGTIPSDGKRLGNQVPHIRYGHTSLG
jgi:hypothetical protein